MSASTEPYDLELPSYDPEALKVGVVHLGFGAFHRAHQALYFDRLAADQGETDWGIAVVNLRGADSDGFAKTTASLPYVLRSLSGDGATVDRLMRVHRASYDWSRDSESAERLLSSPDVQLVTMTVSEAGYYLDGNGDLDTSHPKILAEKSADRGTTIFSYLAGALARRMQGCNQPLTLACCDNIRGNGAMLERVFTQYLAFVDQAPLLEWVRQNVSFPNSMVDRITPKPPGIALPDIEAQLGYGLGPTIVAEDFVQWVIEDKFAGKKPSLDLVGVTITKDVEPYEETKIRVLNGGHTALTYMGALAGFETFDEAFVSDDLNDHFGAFEQAEVLSALPSDLPFDASEYLATIDRRFRNQHIGDTVERICGDGFAKFPIFIRPTLEGCFERGQVPKHAIRSIASWVIFSRRVFNKALKFDYHEPNKDRLVPLVAQSTLDDFVNSEPLWGDIGKRFPQFKTELEKQIEVVEQKWPA